MASRPILRLTAGAALIVLLGACVGCSTGGSRSGSGAVTYAAAETTATGSAATGTPASGTPDAVALAVTAAWLAYDTRVDRGPGDTARRLALPWLAPALHRDLAEVSGGTPPGAQWSGWTARHAHATVAARLGEDDRPPDSPVTAWRQVAASITLHGDDHWTATLDQTLFIELTMHQGRWLVSDVGSGPD